MDIIKVTTSNNETLEMEVVIKYTINNKNYVIYKEKDVEKYYMAKYNFLNDDLDTDLAEDEIIYGNKVLKELLNDIKC